MTVIPTKTSLRLSSRLVNGILAIKPLANFAKTRARNMMINRAEALGVPWRKNLEQLSERNWEQEWDAVVNRQLQYPEYYVTSFHAYPDGNLSWKAAWEVESAAYAVHAKIWQEAGIKGDAKLRQSYHQVLQEQLTSRPATIVDLGCGVGMSTLTLQDIYPQAQITGIDLSPYFLAVASYRASQASTKAQNIILEARRILRPGGHLAIMDMNPQSEQFLKMPSYILTLLKSTEPYLDQYFSLDIEKTLVKSGFTTPAITFNSPRHRTIIAKIASI